MEILPDPNLQWLHPYMSMTSSAMETSPSSSGSVSHMHILPPSAPQPSIPDTELLRGPPHCLAQPKAGYPLITWNVPERLIWLLIWCYLVWGLHQKTHNLLGVRRCPVSVHDQLASSLPTLSRQCPTQFGCGDYYDSVCPHPFIPGTQGRLFGCAACQFDYLSGWRHGRRVKIFKCWLRRTHLVQSDRSGQGRSSQAVEAQHILWLLLLFLLFSNQCRSQGTSLEIPSLIEFYRRKKKSGQLYLASVVKICRQSFSTHLCNWKVIAFFSLLFGLDDWKNLHTPL